MELNRFNSWHGYPFFISYDKYLFVLLEFAMEFGNSGTMTISHQFTQPLFNLFYADSVWCIVLYWYKHVKLRVLTFQNQAVSQLVSESLWYSLC